MIKKLLIVSLMLTFALSCVNRADAISRSMEWVKDGVPYNKNAYHQGYVQGCEGIVGYGWNFPKPGIYSG
jgi:hypothetical protein